ncbi:RING-H2 finger protein ATL29-like [Quercus robur]|uniref:RING-H2 finger protein ATL29-like n=1 Tax=Quercus robur TaxID=38942 RepID=UPI002161FC5C|nr:RING-H2 finger protein ATL29-like [Quercus robur]
MATDPSPSTVNPTAAPPVAALLTAILLVFFLLGFLSVYLCRCFIQNVTGTFQIQGTPSGNVIGAAAKTGLDPSLIQSFPTFLYSSVKDFRKEEYGLECAICLLEFEDDSLLRLLSVCYHVFHQECIDLWLESHKTCPVCRRDLDLPPDSLDKYSKELIYNLNHMHDSHHENNNQSLEDVVRIDVKEDEHGGESQDEHALQRKQMDEDKKVEIIARSHTTGHSMVRTRARQDSVDRYTLRLPEHVKIRLIRGDNCTKSCTTFGEFSKHTTTNNGFLAEV